MPKDERSQDTCGGLFGRLQDELDRRHREERLSPIVLLELSDDLRRLVQAIMREGELSTEEVASAVGLSKAEAEKLLPALEKRGFLTSREAGGSIRYKAKLVRRRGRQVPQSIWDALSDKLG